MDNYVYISGNKVKKDEARIYFSSIEYLHVIFGTCNLPKDLKAFVTAGFNSKGVREIHENKIYCYERRTIPPQHITIKFNF